MEKLNPNLRNFIIGAVGYTLGAIVGILFIILVSRLGLARGLFNLIDDNQALVRILAVPVLVGLLLALGGGLLGGVGGWVLGGIMCTLRKREIAIGGGIAFAATTSVLMLVFLLLVSFIALYNNLSTNRVEHFGLIFGLFGLVFGLLSGILQAFMTVRLRYTWRVILATTLGFAVGGTVLGLVVRAFNPTTGFKTYPVLTFVILALALLSPFFFGGGALGFTYGRLAQRFLREGKEVGSLQPSNLQLWIVAVIGAAFTFWLLSTLGQIKNFLVIQPGDLASQLSPVSVGVRWSEPQQASIDLNLANTMAAPVQLSLNGSGPPSLVWVSGPEGADDIFLQEALVDGNGIFQGWDTPLNISNSAETVSAQPQVASDASGEYHIVWVEGGSPGEAAIYYSRCADGTCTPGVALPELPSLTCVPEGEYLPSQPAIAVDETGDVMIAWNADGAGIVYSTWTASSTPPSVASGCVPGTSGSENLTLQLSSWGEGNLVLAFTTSGEEGVQNIAVSEFDGEAWSAAPETIAQGERLSLAVARDGDYHLAWCAEDGLVHYQAGSGSDESISHPGCSSPPSIAIDHEGLPHLVWYADEILDTNGVARQASILVESIRKNDVWSEPAIAAQTAGPVQPSLTADETGYLYLLWEELAQDQPQISYSLHDPYTCEGSDLSNLERVGLEVLTNGGFRSPGSLVPYCRNRFERIIYTPNPEPKYSDLAITPNGAFDQNALAIDNAQYEILFVTMQWEPDDSPPSPGSVMAGEVARLYNKIKQDPSQFPRGLTVRILLGNYPVVSNFQWGSQVMDVLTDLREAGVDKMVDPEIGWRLEVANFPGTYPHSHTKFLVVDGKTVVAVGFNYGYLHLPINHPSGKGYDMLDLGIEVTGPVAQDSIMTYDDLWGGADQIHCEDLSLDNEKWTETCEEVKAVADHAPEVLRTYLPPNGDTNAFSLYRSQAYKEGDEFIAASLASAEETVDMLQVNFSLEMICMLNLIFPDACTFDNALPYMDSLTEAIENNGTNVRVIMENTNSNGLENRIGGIVLMNELERRGLSDHVDLRFYDGKIHAKATLIDGELLIIGSQNMHYSSWGKNGLTEYSLAVDDPHAIAEFKALYENKWQDAIPFEKAEYGSSP